MNKTIIGLALLLCGCGAPKGLPLDEQIQRTKACLKAGGRVLEQRYAENNAVSSLECSFIHIINYGKPCSDKGGVPIFSSWDGRLKDCKFKRGE